MYTFEPERSYSVPEAAKILGVSRGAVAKRVRRGTLPAERIGRSYAIRGCDLVVERNPMPLPDEPVKGSKEDLLPMIFPNVPPDKLSEAKERFDGYLRFVADLAHRIERERSPQDDPGQ